MMMESKKLLSIPTEKISTCLWSIIFSRLFLKGYFFVPKLQFMAGLRKTLHLLLLALTTLFSLELSGYHFKESKPHRTYETVQLPCKYFSGDIILPSTTSSGFFGSKIFSPAIAIDESPAKQSHWIFNSDKQSAISDDAKKHSLLIIFPFHYFW